MKKDDKTKSVGVQDIADKLKISASTVSRALNDHPKISKITKEKVLEAALKMGYNPSVPNLMIPDKNDIIGLVAPNLERTFYRRIMDGARDVLEKNGFNLIVFTTQKNPETIEKLQESCLKMNIRGIIYIVCSETNPLTVLENFHKNNMPCLLINHTQEDFPYTYVIPDIFQGVYDLTMHLIESGCRSIVLFAEDADDLIDATITDGFKSALAGQNSGSSKRNVFFIPGENRQEILDQLKIMFTDSNPPDGLIASSPEIAFIILNFLNENGVRVPEDVLLAVIGEDQDPFFFKPSLSRLVLSGNNLGQIASGELLKQLKDINYQQRTVVLPVKFIIKNSTLKP